MLFGKAFCNSFEEFFYQLFLVLSAPKWTWSLDPAFSDTNSDNIVQEAYCPRLSSLIHYCKDNVAAFMPVPAMVVVHSMN